MRALRAVLHASGVGPIAAGVTLATATSVAVQGPLPLPVNGAVARAWPLAALAYLPAARWVVGLSNRWLEASAGRRRRAAVVALGSIAIATCTGVALGALVALAAGDDGSRLHVVEVARNAALALGAALVADRATRGHDLGWAAPAFAVIAAWLFGARPIGVPPPSWAITSAPADDVVSGAVTVAAVVGGLVALLVSRRWR